MSLFKPSGEENHKKNTMRKFLYGGGMILILALGIVACFFYYGKPTDTLIVDKEKALIIASLDVRKKELATQAQQLGKAQKEVTQNQEEYRKLLKEMQQLEGVMEKIFSARNNRETSEELAQLETIRLAAEKRVRLKEEKKFKQAEEERLQAEAAAAKDTLDLTNIDKLTKIYEGMRPAAMAVIIKELREELALQILLRMEERKVSRLFASLDPAHAASLSSKLNELKKKGR